MSNRPIIGVTMGDPAGIGPEIILQAFSEPSIYETCRPLVLGDFGLLSKLNGLWKKDLRIHCLESPPEGIYDRGTLDMMSLSTLCLDEFGPGRPSKETGHAMVTYITTAVDMALAGDIDGLTTCPINKYIMHQAGFPFQGHTEFLADKTGTSDYVMMLAGPQLRVALVTIHMALAEVAEQLTAERVLKTLVVTHRGLVDTFGISAPRLAVAALNPHGGEGGLFGTEEEDQIRPAIEKAKAQGIDASGPYAADTLFYWAMTGKWDAVICMYHDQGLIPFKMVHFKDGVNTTLGLPIVRTSVDHGTAYDIAGTGKADPESLIASINLVARQAMARANTARSANPKSRERKHKTECRPARGWSP